MKNFYYCNPTKIIFGKSSIKSITREIPKKSRVLVMSGFTTLYHDFLKIPLKQLIQIRSEAEHCVKCTNKGIHRYFDVNAFVQTIDGKRVIKRN